MPSGKGRWVQVRNAREQALFPPSPYNTFNLPDAFVASLQDPWLRMRTDLVELVEHTNKQLKVKPFRREPPWGTASYTPLVWRAWGAWGACAPLAFSCLLEKAKKKKRKREREKKEKEGKKEGQKCLSGVCWCGVSHRHLTTADTSGLAARSCPCRPTDWL